MDQNQMDQNQMDQNQTDGSAADAWDIKFSWANMNIGQTEVKSDFQSQIIEKGLKLKITNHNLFTES